MTGLRVIVWAKGAEMVCVVDMRCDMTAWNDLLARIVAEVGDCPHLAQRAEGFAVAAHDDLARGGEAYLVLDPVAEDGVAVMRARPGPEAEKFLRDVMEGRA